MPDIAMRGMACTRNMHMACCNEHVIRRWHYSIAIHKKQQSLYILQDHQMGNSIELTPGLQHAGGCVWASFLLGRGSQQDDAARHSHPPAAAECPQGPCHRHAAHDAPAAAHDCTCAAAAPGQPAPPPPGSARGCCSAAEARLGG